jgi:hypothetical protein
MRADLQSLAVLATPRVAVHCPGAVLGSTWFDYAIPIARTLAVELRLANPGLPLIVVSQYVQHSYAADLLESGGGRGVGYLPKESG